MHPTISRTAYVWRGIQYCQGVPKVLFKLPEMLDPTIRWTDRLQSSSGDWTGNIFDFFFEVNSKIAKDIKKPFKLDGITRIPSLPTSPSSSY